MAEESEDLAVRVVVDERDKKPDRSWLKTVVGGAVVAIITLGGTLYGIDSVSDDTQKSIASQAQSSKDSIEGQSRNARESFTRDQQRSAFSEFVNATYDSERSFDPLRVVLRDSNLAAGLPADVIATAYREFHERIMKVTLAYTNMQVYLPQNTLDIAVPLFIYYTRIDTLLWQMDRESRSIPVTPLTPSGKEWNYRIDWLGDLLKDPIAKPDDFSASLSPGSIGYELKRLMDSARNEFGANAGK